MATGVKLPVHLFLVLNARQVVITEVELFNRSLANLSHEALRKHDSCSSSHKFVSSKGLMCKIKRKKFRIFVQVYSN